MGTFYAVDDADVAKLLGHQHDPTFLQVLLNKLQDDFDASELQDDFDASEQVWKFDAGDGNSVIFHACFTHLVSDHSTRYSPLLQVIPGGVELGSGWYLKSAELVKEINLALQALNETAFRQAFLDCHKQIILALENAEEDWKHNYLWPEFVKEFFRTTEDPEQESGRMWQFLCAMIVFWQKAAAADKQLLYWDGGWHTYLNLDVLPLKYPTFEEKWTAKEAERQFHNEWLARKKQTLEAQMKRRDFEAAEETAKEILMARPGDFEAAQALAKLEGRHKKRLLPLRIGLMVGPLLGFVLTVLYSPDIIIVGAITGLLFGALLGFGGTILMHVIYP